MDPEQHRRFLNYLDLKQYFVRKGNIALDAAAFAELDQELIGLLERERDGDVSNDQVRRIVVLRRLLLRD